jgi:histidine kinase/DNA gyrase B/HSP90-like ATPase
MSTSPNKSETTKVLSPETIGHPSGKIPVELSTRFLEHFSEQLYSSPQKAFEELISNGWDAGANCVDVRISTNLKDPNATMCVLDNGVSMDAEGLRWLWRIAFSPKNGIPSQYGRPLIGTFGIGKLATYVLAKKLTYICKASDGVIRRVTMDYGTIDHQKGATQDRLISELELDLYEVTESEIEEALESVYEGALILDLIREGGTTTRGCAG